MKYYEYKVLDKAGQETDEEFLDRVNELAGRGFKYHSEVISENATRVLLEKTTE